jgi:hypothetical protein
MQTMKKWVLSVLATLIIIGTAEVLYLALHRPNAPAPSFQVTNVSISKPKITDTNNPIFHGQVKESCSFYYTASDSVTCVLIFSNFNSSSKSVNVTCFINDSVQNAILNVNPYATYICRYDLFKGQFISGSISISGGEENLYFHVTYTNYTQSIDFSFNLANSGSSDGFAVVEFRSDGTPVWSNKYTLVAGGSEREIGTVKIPDKAEHTFQLLMVQQG